MRPTSLLDIACGAGYGSHGLALALPDCDVVGGDYDPAAVESARASHRAANLSYVEADITRWNESLGPRTFDCVVSFDTLEHVEHREIAMKNLVQHLSDDGVLLLSTPVRSANVLNPGWEHHKIEFSRASLHDFLRRYFAEVHAPDFGTLPHVDVFDQVNRGIEPQFYLLKMNPVLCRGPIRVDEYPEGEGTVDRADRQPPPVERADRQPPPVRNEHREASSQSRGLEKAAEHLAKCTSRERKLTKRLGRLEGRLADIEQSRWWRLGRRLDSARRPREAWRRIFTR